MARLLPDRESLHYSLNKIKVFREQSQPGKESAKGMTNQVFHTRLLSVGALFDLIEREIN